MKFISYPASGIAYESTTQTTGIHADLLWNILLGSVEMLVFYFLGTLIQRLVNHLSRRARNRGVWTFMASFANIFCKLVGVIIMLDQMGVSMNLIIGALSALGVGISLALKDNMASVAGGLQLLLTKPFKVGDYIKMGKHEGQVKSIEITFTTLNTRNNEEVVIPNNSLIIKSITNYSNEPERRVVINYPSNKNDIYKNERELLIAAENSQLVLKKPEPSVRIVSYTLDGANLELLAYTLPENYWQCSSEIMSNIHRLQSFGLIDAAGQATEVNGDQDEDAQPDQTQNPDQPDDTKSSPIPTAGSAIKDVDQAIKKVVEDTTIQPPLPKPVGMTLTTLDAQLKNDIEKEKQMLKKEKQAGSDKKSQDDGLFGWLDPIIDPNSQNTQDSQNSAGSQSEQSQDSSAETGKPEDSGR